MKYGMPGSSSGWQSLQNILRKRRLYLLRRSHARCGGSMRKVRDGVSLAEGGHL